MVREVVSMIVGGVAEKDSETGTCCCCDKHGDQANVVPVDRDLDVLACIIVRAVLRAAFMSSLDKCGGRRRIEKSGSHCHRDQLCRRCKCYCLQGLEPGACTVEHVEQQWRQDGDEQKRGLTKSQCQIRIRRGLGGFSQCKDGAGRCFTYSSPSRHGEDLLEGVHE